MLKTCNDCGAEFTAIKPHFDICFDCYLARIRQAKAEREALFFLPAKSSGKVYTRNTSNKQATNKLSILGGKADAMPGKN